jgi:hypothetical protein
MNATRRIAVYGVVAALTTGALFASARTEKPTKEVLTQGQAVGVVDTTVPTIAPSSIDPANSAAIAALPTASPADAVQLGNQTDALPVDPISDQGISTEIAAVKTAVIGAIQTQIAALSVPAFGTPNRVSCFSTVLTSGQATAKVKICRTGNSTSVSVVSRSNGASVSSSVSSTNGQSCIRVTLTAPNQPTSVTSFCGTTAIDLRQSAVRSRWTTGSSPTKQIVLDGMNQALSQGSDPDRVGYSDGRFVIDEWKGVSVSGSTATAVAIAHQELLMNPSDPSSSFGAEPGGWENNYLKGLWQFWLVKENGQWVLTDIQGPSTSN